MNTARKIESSSYPPFRRQSDRVDAVNQAIARVEREHAGRRRRLTIMLVAAALLIVVNGIVIVTFN